MPIEKRERKKKKKTKNERRKLELPLKFSSSFGKLLASQAGVSRTGLAINGAFSTTSPLLPSEKCEYLLKIASKHIHP